MEGTWSSHGKVFDITALKPGFVPFALHISLALYTGTFSSVWFSCTFRSLGLQVLSSWMSIVLLLFYSEIVLY